MRVLLIVVIALVLAPPIILAALLAFGTSAPPPVLESISAPFRTVDFSDLPPAETLAARDGVPLAYRRYDARPINDPSRIVIAIHGSSGSSASMHPLAKALAGSGMTVYAPDMRGHGDSGRRGDDLADFVAALK